MSIPDAKVLVMINDLSKKAIRRIMEEADFYFSEYWSLLDCREVLRTKYLNGTIDGDAIASEWESA